MKTWLALLIGICTSITTWAAANPSRDTPEPMREWTFMFFENAKNNLEDFLFEDVNEMEAVGSTDQMNLVVEYGSLEQKRVFRTKLNKDNDPKKITSPVLQELGNADMGDWKQVVDFAVWAMKKYPARHYFLSISDHGSGWHRFRKTGQRGISWDDVSGNYITTTQLAMAFATIEKNAGKLTIYGSDACLMMMAEVAAESWGFVDIFAGSQEVEPGEGWDYTAWLGGVSGMLRAGGRYRQIANDPKFVVSHLAKTFVKEGTKERTFSGFDNSLMVPIVENMKLLSAAIASLPAGEISILNKISDSTFRFYEEDYADVLDFLLRVEAAARALPNLDSKLVATTRYSIQQAIFVNQVTPDYQAAKGLSIWLPSKSLFNNYVKEYSTLRFDRSTGWSAALAKLVGQKRF